MRRIRETLRLHLQAGLSYNEVARALKAWAFESGARVITLLGIGGIGKTRLVRRYARSWLGTYPGGAWFCDLTQARGTDEITFAVAQALYHRSLP